MYFPVTGGLILGIAKVKGLLGIPAPAKINITQAGCYNFFRIIFKFDHQAGLSADAQTCLHLSEKRLNGRVVGT